MLYAFLVSYIVATHSFHLRLLDFTLLTVLIRYTRLPWLRRLVAGLSLRMSGSVHVRFVVGRVALGQVFLRILRHSPVSIIPPWFPIFMYHLGDEQKARWLPHLMDMVSPHRHDHHQDTTFETVVWKG